jgi:hypothetical protein
MPLHWNKNRLTVKLGIDMAKKRTTQDTSLLIPKQMKLPRL